MEKNTALGYGIFGSIASLIILTGLLVAWVMDGGYLNRKTDTPVEISPAIVPTNPEPLNKTNEINKTKVEQSRSIDDLIKEINRVPVPVTPNPIYKKPLTKKVKVKYDVANVIGKYNRNDVARIIKSRLFGIRKCYEKDLRELPDLSQGIVIVEFGIGSSGKCSICKVLLSEIENSEIQRCTCRMIRRWKFPVPEEGEVKVKVKFTFSQVDA